MGELTQSSGRARIRDVLPQIVIGRWSTGKLNSITDVPGVLVHTETINTDEEVHTGVTAILPRHDWYKYSSMSGIFSLNGAGEMTGSHWIDDTGLLTSPIIITNTSAIGDGYRGVMDYVIKHHPDKDGENGLFMFPTVAETYDGYLCKQRNFPVTPAHVVASIEKASSARVPEGNTGGGTGMICHRFKGGTGSSSRSVPGVDAMGKEATYTVGVLVQANYGAQDTLHIAGVPIGRILQKQDAAKAASMEDGIRKDGSIIVIIATDCPLTPVQLQRVARRATIGVAKVGGYGTNSSGDIFLAFSTASKHPIDHFSSDDSGEAEDFIPVNNPYHPVPRALEMTDNSSINGIFEAAADATEESIYNALCMAETTTGFQGRVVEALDLDKVKEIVGKRTGQVEHHVGNVT